MRKGPRTTAILCGLVVGVLSIGAMHQKKVEQQMEQPVNCTTAEGDIRVLENEHTNTLKAVASGVGAIVPAGIVVGVMTGTEGTTFRIATGAYNREIDRRIREMRTFCNLP